MVPVLGFLLYLSRHKYASTGVCFHNHSYSANGSKPGGTFNPVIRSSGESNLEIKVMLLVLVTDVLRTWGEVIICIKLLDSGYDFCSGCGNIHHCYHQQSFSGLLSHTIRLCHQSDYGHHYLQLVFTKTVVKKCEKWSPYYFHLWEFGICDTFITEHCNFLWI